MQNDSSTTSGVEVGEQPDDKLTESAQVETEMRHWVYCINGIEWWAADSMDQAIEAASIWYGLPLAEIVDELAPPYKLSEEQMFQTLIDVDRVAVPFWFELTRLYREGQPFPRLFGRSEL